MKITKPGWHNIKYRFLPPKVVGVLVKPLDPSIPVETPFTSDMFEESGFLHEEMLNHFLRIARPNAHIQINVGYLWHHFMISDNLGYMELARLLHLFDAEALINKATTKDEEATTTESPDSPVQEESPKD